MTNTFSNDGSFFEQFQKLADTPQPAESQDTSSQPQEDPSQTQGYAAYYAGYGGAPYGYGQPGYPPAAQPGYPPSYPSYGFPPLPPRGGQTSYYGPGAGYGAPPVNQPRQDDKQQPTKSLWLGNVHPETTEQELRSAFQEYGPIENIKIVPHKNCAFLNYADINSAIAAHSTGYGKYIRGQELRIGWGRTSERQSEPREDLGPKSKNLWVGNIGPDVTERQVREKFEPFGVVESVKLLPQKNCGFVNFDSIESAQRAKRELYGQYLGDRPMKINYGRIESNESSIPPASRAPPPPEVVKPVPPPADPELQDVIDKMADFVSRNGSAFENIIREKQRGNPKFQFLFDGGENYGYYRYKLHSLQENKAGQDGGRDGPSPQSVQPPPAITSVPLSTTDRASLDAVIDALDGTKDTIKHGKDWILQHWNQAESIATHLRSRVESFPQFEPKLNVLYLVSDALHHAMARRAEPTAVDTLSEAFKLPLVFIMRSAYIQHPEHQDKVMQLLKLWDSRSIYGGTTVSRMIAAIQSATPPAEPPHTLNPNMQGYNYPPPSSAPYGQPFYPAQPQQPQQPAGQSYGGFSGAPAYPAEGDRESRNYGSSRKRQRSPSPPSRRSSDRRRESDDRWDDKREERDERRNDRRDDRRESSRRERRSGWDS